MQHASELLNIPRCRVVLLRDGSTEYSSDVIAEGCLKVLELPHEVLILSVGTTGLGASAPSPGEFYYPVLASTPICVASDFCITVPALGGNTDVADVYGLLVEPIVESNEGGAATVCDLERLLLARGVPVQQRNAMTDQHWASATIELYGAKATEVIAWGTTKLAQSIRESGSYVKGKLAECEEPVVVSYRTEAMVSNARSVSKIGVNVCDSMMSMITKRAGKLGEKLGQVSERPAEGTKATVKQVGATTVRAGMGIYASLQDAADSLVDEVCGTAADVVSHKYGEDAGATTREGLHVVGSAWDITSNLTGKRIAKNIAKKSCKEAGHGFVRGSAADVSSTTGGASWSANCSSRRSARHLHATSNEARLIKSHPSSLVDMDVHGITMSRQFFNLTLRTLSGEIVLGPQAVPRTLTVGELRSTIRGQQKLVQSAFDIIRSDGFTKLPRGERLWHEGSGNDMEVIAICRYWAQGQYCIEPNFEPYEENYSVEVFDGSEEDLIQCFAAHNDRASLFGTPIDGRDPEHSCTNVCYDDGTFLKRELEKAKSAFGNDLESLQALLDFIGDETCSYFTCFDAEDKLCKWQLHITEALVGGLRIRVTDHERPWLN